MVQPKCPSSSPQVHRDRTGNAFPAWGVQGCGRLCGTDFGTLGSQGPDLFCRERMEHRPASPSQCLWWPRCQTTMGPCELTLTLQKHPPQKARSMGICCPLPAPIQPRGHVSFLCSQRLSSFGKLNNETNKQTKKERGREKEGRVLGKVVLAYDNQEVLHRDQQADSVNNGVQWPLGLAPPPPAVFTPFFTPLAPQH